MEKKTRKWKVDELTMVFIVAIAIIALSLLLRKENDAKQSAEEITVRIIGNPNLNLVKNGQVDQSQLNEIQKMDYQQLKNSIQSDSDFCLYIEDENGNVILYKGSDALRGACR